MASAEIRTPNGRATIDAPGQIATERVVVSAQVGEFPTVQLSTHPRVDGTQQAMRIFSSTATGFMGDVQGKMFEERTSPDVTVAMADGKGGSLSLEAYSTTPNYDVGYGELTRGLMAVGRDAILNNLRTSIYKWRNPDGLANFAAVIQKSTTSASPADRFRDILAKMVELWRLNPAYNFEAERQASLSIDRVNTEARHRLNLIVAGSHVDLEEWKAIDNKDPNYTGLNAAINTMICGLLQSSNSDFLWTLQNFCSQFQLQYVPNLSLRPGRLIRMEDTVTGEEVPKEAEVGSISISAGNRDTLAVQAVAVNGVSVPGTNFGVVTALNPTGSPVESRGISAGLYFYPEQPYTGGKIVEVGMPPYMPDETDVTGRVLKDSVAAVPNMTVAQYESKHRGLNASVAPVFFGAIQPMIKRHARNIYADLALRGSTVTLQVPLDLSWTLGTRYRVTAKGERADGSGGTVLFRGFLARVAHSLSGGARSSASTSLTFTHAMCAPYVLSLP